MSSPYSTFQFWAVDDDRSCGWTNHGYVLQLVAAAKGRDPAEAWERSGAPGASNDPKVLRDRLDCEDVGPDGLVITRLEDEMTWEATDA